MSRATLDYFVDQEPRIAGMVDSWRSGLATLVSVLLIAAVFALLPDREESEAARHGQSSIVRASASRWRSALADAAGTDRAAFLFNTLANVRRLYQTDAAAAESMLENLMRYLAVALPQMRAVDSTLGREAVLTESYLAIQRIRMGRRLAFDFDIPQSLREAPVPPMMVLTLVENAIKHGLNPLPEGGFVRDQRARRERSASIAGRRLGTGFHQDLGWRHGPRQHPRPACSPCTGRQPSSASG